jgi:hypothetical protein
MKGECEWVVCYNPCPYSSGVVFLLLHRFVAKRCQVLFALSIRERQRCFFASPREAGGIRGKVLLKHLFHLPIPDPPPEPLPEPE